MTGRRVGASALLAGVLFACGAGWATAADETRPTYAPTYQRCIQGGLVDFIKRECQSAEMRRMDGSLNTLYKSLYSKSDAAHRKLLKDSERAWLAFRKAECAFETNDTAGGTLGPVILNDCYMEITYHRIEVLKRMSQ
jgi:uncharacterized protein YecT (DUF1311 family)